MNIKNSSYEFLMVAAAAILVILIYTSALPGPFVFDDEANITDNRHIRITSLNWDQLYTAAFKSPIVNRPVANLSFALNYYFNGYNVVGFRFVNLLIHITNGFLLYALARATLQTPAMAAYLEKTGLAAAFAAVVWLVHPLHTQSVAYIVQRMTSMAVMFYMLSMLCYAKARMATSTGARAALLAGCGLAGLLALGSKEIAATLPAFLLLYEWYFFQIFDRSWLRRFLPGIAIAGFLTAVISLVFIGGRNPFEHIVNPYAGGDFSAWQRVLTQLRVVCVYMSLMLWPDPARLNLDYDFPASDSLLAPPSTLVALLVIAAVLFLALRLARREPLLSFAILWFFGNLAIESSVIRLETVFEHRTYLPSVMPVVAFVAFLLKRVRLKWVAIGVLSAVAAGWAGWTYQRSQIWSDAVTLWLDCISKSPLKSRPYNNLGVALIEKGRLAESESFFRKAIELRPNYGDARYNLGYVMIRSDRLEEGIRQLQEAIRLEPENYMAYNNLGIAYLFQENYPRAIRHFQEALRLKPDFEGTHNNLGVALKNQGDLVGAASEFAEAIRLKPDYAEAYNNLGLTLKEQGRLAEAADDFRRALLINPGFDTARQNLDEVAALMRKD
ncbi:MAG: tetratricopeptide repeat protein [Hyphomicrobiales bacterium]